MGELLLSVPVTSLSPVAHFPPTQGTRGHNSATKLLPRIDKTLNFTLSTIHECTHPHKVTDVVPFQVSVKRKDGLEGPGSWIRSASGAELVAQQCSAHKHSSKVEDLAGCLAATLELMAVFPTIT